MKTRLWKGLAFLMVLTMTLPLSAVIAEQPAPAVKDPSAMKLEPAQVDDVMSLPQTGKVFGESKGETEPGIYIIQLEDPALALYRGGIKGLQPTNIDVLEIEKLDVDSAASVSYLDYLSGVQANLENRIAAQLGRELMVRFRYRHTYNGLAMVLTPDEAAQVAAMPGVKRVERDHIEQIQTDVGPWFIGADGIWDGIDTAGLPGTKGEGMLVGIIDTGINLDHPSFTEVGPIDGYTHTNPLGAGNFLGACFTDPGLYTCNNKLIGAYDFADAYGTENDGPDDHHGHGSHTASTTAGNVVTATVIGHSYITTQTISGVAPHANIIMYDTCDGGGCPGEATMAAANQAVIDGVDVINYSIGSIFSMNPWDSAAAQNWLGVREAGVFVATSAGNEGPYPETIGSPANSPWMLTVGAVTHNRTFTVTLTGMEGGTGVPADMIGTGFTSGYGAAEIVHARDFGDGLCLDPFAPGTFTGQLVMCDRGEIALVDKEFNVRYGGAGGFVLGNAASNYEETHVIDYDLPAVHLGYSDAQVLRTWLTDTVVQTATIGDSDYAIDDSIGDVMASFSSRGPNPDSTFAQSIIRPDVTAPGVSVMAASKDGIEYQFMGGTSMASPHAAGAATLIRALYPGWTAAEVQSALMMTAITEVVKADGVTPATPFDMGSGRVNLNEAAKVGFVLDEVRGNFDAADPSAGGKPKTLNLASLGNGECLAYCSWTRTLRGVTDTIDYTVDTYGPAGLVFTAPSTFAVSNSEDYELNIQVDVTALDIGEWYFGGVVFIPDDPSVATAHFPVAVRPSAGVLPQLVTINTRRNEGSKLVEDIETMEASALTITPYGLSLAARSMITGVEQAVIPPPPAFPGIFFQPAAYTETIAVPAGTQRLVVEVLDTTSPDLDMLVGFDDDDDGIIEYSDLVAGYCQSAAGGSYERCSIMAPAEGTWFVMIINYAASVPAGDDIDLAIGVVGADAGNMTFDAPATTAAKVPFDIRLIYNEPSMEAGDVWYGAFGMGSTAVSGDDIGVVAVDLYRHGDDVSKSVDALLKANGDVVTYTVEIQPNITGGPLTYIITDVVPAGVTLDPGSVTANMGTVGVTGNQITWTVSMPFETYDMVTNETEPTCMTPFGGYYDWYTSPYHFGANPEVYGDSSVFTFLSSDDPFSYFGEDYQGVGVTDDGFAIFDVTNNYAGYPWFHQILPDPLPPSNLVAGLWFDGEIVYDETNNYGVTVVSNGGNLNIIEYDDLQPYTEGDPPPTDTFDMQIWITREADDSEGAYEIVLAYDNVVSLPPLATVGVENALGDVGVVLFNDTDPASVIYDGLQVCFDWVQPNDPAVLAFEGTVAGSLGDLVVNRAEHCTDDPECVTREAEATFTVWEEPVAIYDIQYVADPGSGDASPYAGQMVWVEGVVTGATDDFSGEGYFIADPAGGPWSGLYISHGGDRSSVDEGDHVAVYGKVQEFNGLTELYTGDPKGRQYVISAGNPLPVPILLTTYVYSNAAGPASAEQWESVLIRFEHAQVVDPVLGNGEWAFDDGSGATRADDFSSSLTYAPSASDLYAFIQGLGFYSGGDYKLVPRYDPDIGLAPDLSVLKVADPSVYTAGALITYTVTVENPGPSDAVGVVVTDTLPAELSGTIGITAKGTYLDGVWTVGILAAEEIAELTLMGTVDSAYTGTLTNTVEVNSETVDPELNNNFYTLVTTGQSAADLAVSKVADPVAYTAGELITYTVTVENLGPSDALGVVVTDTLPVGISGTIGITAAGTYEDGIWKVGTLPGGETAELTLVGTVDAMFEGSLTNTVEVDSPTTDPNLANNFMILETVKLYTVYLPLVLR